MNIFNKTIRKIHKYSGLVIALFFIMWFATGIILLFHKYPKVEQEETFAHMEPLSQKELPEIYDIPCLNDITKVRTLSVSRDLGQTVWTISGASNRKEHAMDKNNKSAEKFLVVGDTLIPQEIINK